MTLTLCFLCFGCLVPAVLLQDTAQDQIDISFSDKTLRCMISELYQGADSCNMFMYIDNKYVADGRSLNLQHVYKKLLRVTVRCDATCTLGNSVTATLQSKDLVINSAIFIGLCCLGVFVFLLIVGLLLFLVWWRRRRDKEEPRKPLTPLEEKTAHELYSVPDKTKKMVLETTLDDDNFPEEEDGPDKMDNISFNPWPYRIRYNYSEKTSDT